LDLAAHIDDDWDEQHERTFEAVFGNTRKVRGTRFDLIHSLESLQTIPDTEFYACCGTDDWLYQDTITFRDAAAEKGLYLTYEESAGEHKWEFWDDYIQRVLEWLPIENLEKDREVTDETQCD
jgi:S-formylglutathione hydrolase FrmB